MFKYLNCKFVIQPNTKVYQLILFTVQIDHLIPTARYTSVSVLSRIKRGEKQIFLALRTYPRVVFGSRRLHKFYNNLATPATEMHKVARGRIQAQSREEIARVQF